MEENYALTFNPRLLQWEFITTDAEYPVLQGEFNSGKTRTSVSKCIKLVKMFPACTGIVIRNFIGDLRDSTVPQFFLNYWGSEDVPPGHDYNSTYRRLIFPNGSKILFLALDKEKDIARLKNMVFTFAWLEQMEEIMPEVFEMCTSRNRQQLDGNTVFGSANNEDGSWVNEYFFSNELDVQHKTLSFGSFENVKVEGGIYQGKNKDYLGIREMPMANKINVRKDYYKKMSDNLTKDAVLRYVFNKAVGKGGSVYPFNDDCVVEEDDYIEPYELTEFDKIFEAMDYGISETNPMVWLWEYQDFETGVIYIINEYYEYGKGIQKCCDYVQGVNAIFPWKSVFRVGCPRAFQKEGTSDLKPADLFTQNKLPMINFRVIHAVRQPIVEKKFETGKLKIYRRCKNLINELKKQKWKNIDTSENHAIEALERSVARIQMMSASSKIGDMNVDQPKPKKGNKRVERETAGLRNVEF